VTTLASPSNGVYGVTLDSKDLYWTESSGAVVKLPLGGGFSATLATSSGSPEFVTIGGGVLYWSGFSGRSEEGREAVAFARSRRRVLVAVPQSVLDGRPTRPSTSRLPAWLRAQCPVGAPC
jgi:hypothetical protein